MPLVSANKPKGVSSSLNLGPCHDGPIRQGFHLDGLLGQPEEQLAPRPRVAPIESESELVEVVVEVLAADPPLVSPENPALENNWRRGPSPRRNSGSAQATFGATLRYSFMAGTLSPETAAWQDPASGPRPPADPEDFLFLL